MITIPVLAALNRYKFITKPMRLVLAANADLAYVFAKEVLKGKFPEGEEVIAKNPKKACSYAYNVIQDEWPKGEPAIATSASASYLYARDVLERAFPAGERAIKTSPMWAKLYGVRFKGFVAGSPEMQAWLSNTEDQTAEDSAVELSSLLNGREPSRP